MFLGITGSDGLKASAIRTADSDTNCFPSRAQVHFDFAGSPARVLRLVLDGGVEAPERGTLADHLAAGGSVDILGDVVCRVSGRKVEENLAGDFGLVREQDLVPGCLSRLDPRWRHLEVGERGRWSRVQGLSGYGGATGGHVGTVEGSPASSRSGDSRGLNTGHVGRVSGVLASIGEGCVEG